MKRELKIDHDVVDEESRVSHQEPRRVSTRNGLDSAPFYAATVGRPSLLPGTYFRLLLLGYFEGIDSERGIAWRTADSLALRGFLGLDLDEAPPRALDDFRGRGA